MLYNLIYDMIIIGGNMKALKTMKTIVLNILMLVYFAFVILMTVLLLNYNDYGVTQFGDTTLLILEDEISSEIYEKGDLIFVQKKKIDKLNVGDEVFTYQISPEGEVSIDLGKIGELHPDEDAITYENGSNYSMDFVIGSASKVYEDVGTYLSVIESKWGFLFIVLVPSFLIFVYQIYTLIVEIKYGNEEED